MKVALVHDWLTGMRGGEKCLEAACELFPDADIFTLFHDPGSVSPRIESHAIHTSFLQHVPARRHWYRYLLPFFPMAIEHLDLSGYDRVVSLSHAVAKGVIPQAGATHVSYCFSPMRYVWDMYDDYFGHTNPVLKLGISAVATRLRRWDVAATTRCDRIASISEHVRGRVLRYYGRESSVLYPPVEEQFFEAPLAGGCGEYWLVLSALTPYKRIDLAIEAARQTGQELWIVGDGPERRRLEAGAPPNVRFLGWQPAERLPSLYRNARALVFPGLEDFGITPVECQAVGRPVVGFGSGGLLESVRGLDSEDPPTGVFFREQTVGSLVGALEQMEARERDFDPVVLREHASFFRRDRFLREFRKFVCGSGDGPC